MPLSWAALRIVQCALATGLRASGCLAERRVAHLRCCAGGPGVTRHAVRPSATRHSAWPLADDCLAPMQATCNLAVALPMTWSTGGLPRHAICPDKSTAQTIHATSSEYLGLPYQYPAVRGVTVRGIAGEIKAYILTVVHCKFRHRLEVFRPEAAPVSLSTLPIALHR